MAPAGVLVSAALLAFARLPPEEILRRGYELLPDARWLEELERDRATEFLGMALPSPPRSSFTTIALVFSEHDYDRSALYPDKEPRTDLKLGLRASLDRWGNYNLLGHLPSTPFEPPLDPLRLPK